MSGFAISSNVGDDRTVRVTATWPEDVPEAGATAGDPYNLSGVNEIWFTAKLSRDDDDLQAVFQKTLSGDGIRLASAGSNVCYVDVQAADQAELWHHRTNYLYCDVQVRGPDNEVWTVASGTWTLLPQVTRSI